MCETILAKGENVILKALSKITKFLESSNVPYMVFGGVANSIYGNPRQTYDIDLKVQIDKKSELGEYSDNY